MSASYIGVAAICLLALAGCASDRERRAAVEPPLFTVETSDLPEQATFVIVLRSHDRRTLCLESDRWPNDQGGIHYGAGFVRIAHEFGHLSMRDYNMGYCGANGCGLVRIKPGMQVRAFLPYSNFGTEAEVKALRNRKLEYLLPPTPCKSRDNRI